MFCVERSKPKGLYGTSASVSLTVLFVHLEMSSATGLPRMLSKRFTTMDFPIYWLTWQRERDLFLYTCGHQDCLKAVVFILD